MAWLGGSACVPPLTERDTSVNHRAASFPSLLAAALTACSGQQGNAPPRVPVSVARAERRTVPIEVPATGSVEPIQTAAVVPQVEGLVRRVRFQEGQEVAAGQVLFEIDPRQYQAALQQAEANLARDLVQAENAVRDADRYAVLAESASVSQADYQAKRASADA